MQHVFIAKKLGWEKRQFVCFDSSLYSREEAENQFVPYEGTTLKGYPYTGYEYNGEKYHSYQYVGEIEDDKIPRDENELFDYNLRKLGL